MKPAILFAVIGLATPFFAATFDGAQVYKSNCTRCHITLHTYPERMSRSIVRHMRIKAQLTGPEAEAVLAYLASNYNPEPKSKVKKVGQ